MPVPRRDIVQPIIEKHRQPILAAVLGAWDDWLKSPHPGVWRCKRSRANFVWEQIIERAYLEFDDAPAVHIIEGHETFKFMVEHQVLFRFKKGDESGLSANVPAQLALAFHDHNQDMLHLPEVHRVDVVYQLNQLETGIVDVILVARDEEVVVWSYSLLNTDAKVVPLPTTAPSDEPSTLPTRRLVRPREVSQRQNRDRRD